jgi:hypothetical protein
MLVVKIDIDIIFEECNILIILFLQRMAQETERKVKKKTRPRGGTAPWSELLDEKDYKPVDKVEQETKLPPGSLLTCIVSYGAWSSSLQRGVIRSGNTYYVNVKVISPSIHAWIIKMDAKIKRSMQP